MYAVTDEPPRQGEPSLADPSTIPVRLVDYPPGYRPQKPRRSFEADKAERLMAEEIGTLGEGRTGGSGPMGEEQGSGVHQIDSAKAGEASKQNSSSESVIFSCVYFDVIEYTIEIYKIFIFYI